jgi:hypothetical protein
MRQGIRIAACVASAAMLQIAVAGSASAEYLGYGNGDPGNWDYNTEQQGGPCNLPGGHELDASTGQPKCCSQYTPMSLCPMMRSEKMHLYRAPKGSKHE